MSDVLPKPKTWASMVADATTPKPKTPVVIPTKPKHVDLPTAIANLKSFFDSCPTTPVSFVYFTCVDNQCIPKVKSIFHEWFIDNKTVYSIFVPNGWSYTYGISSLKKLLYVDDTGIISFEKQPQLVGAPIHEISKTIMPLKIQREVTATLGDHITIGIGSSIDPNDLLIDTHKTYYVQRRTPTIQYNRRGIYCDCLLYAQSIESCTKCDGKITNMGEQYKDEPIAIPIIQAITNAYKGTTVGGGSHSNSKKNKPKPRKHLYKGVQYDVHNGSRNGKYIQVGNTRKYIGGSLKVTYKGTGYDDEGFIDFLHVDVFSVVALKHPGMEGITIIYDEESYITPGSNKYICIIYAYTVHQEEERASIYYIDALRAFTAYYASKPSKVPNTAYENTCLQEFRAEIVQHIPQVVVV